MLKAKLDITILTGTQNSSEAQSQFIPCALRVTHKFRFSCMGKTRGMTVTDIGHWLSSIRLKSSACRGIAHFSLRKGVLPSQWQYVMRDKCSKTTSEKSNATGRNLRVIFPFAEQVILPQVSTLTAPPGRATNQASSYAFATTSCN